MKVSVFFFGVLTDLTGTGTKICSDVKDIDNLRLRIFDDYPEMVNYSFRIALNNEIVDGNADLTDGDEIAFLPPFAGG